MDFEFKKKREFEKRIEDANKIRKKYPERIPIICEEFPKNGALKLDKNKYLVPHDLTLGQFVFVVRKQIQIPPEKAIFLFINNLLPATSALMSALYETEKDKDGFLYIAIREESTFGSVN